MTMNSKAWTFGLFARGRMLTVLHRVHVIRFIVLGLLLPTWTHADGIIRVKGMAVTFFSSSTSEAFSRIRADEIRPATHRHGPFVVPAVGFGIINPRLDLLGLKCSREDWATVLKALSAWEHMSSQGPFVVTLPDKRVLTLRSMPLVRDGRLIAPLGDGRRNTGLLCIDHDGEAGLRIKIFGVPSKGTPFAESPGSRSEN